MKRISIFLCMVTFIGASLQSCTNSVDNNSPSVVPKVKSMGVNERDTTQRPSNRDIYELVSDYPDIFGTHVLIFDSLPCADTLLDKFADADPESLRNGYSQFGFYNPILESNIIYDSVMNAMAEDMSIDLESDTLTETTLAWFLERFVQEMMDNYSGACIIDEYVDINQETCYTVNPIGIIDERALCNEMGLFIADQVVFKFSGDYLLTCPADIYLLLADYDNMEDLMSDFETYGIDGVTDRDFIVSALEDDNNLDVCQGITMRPNNGLQDDHNRHFRAPNPATGDYMVDTYLTIYPYWSWFYTYYRCKLTISNYYKGTASIQKIGGHFSCKAYGWYGNNEPEDLWFLRNGQRFVNIFREDINSYFKSRTLIESYGGRTYTPTLHTYVDIYYLNLLVIQNAGTNHAVTLQRIEL